jgi:hypothetical protein
MRCLYNVIIPLRQMWKLLWYSWRLWQNYRISPFHKKYVVVQWKMKFLKYIKKANNTKNIMKAQVDDGGLDLTSIIKLHVVFAYLIQYLWWMIKLVKCVLMQIVEEYVIRNWWSKCKNRHGFYNKFQFMLNRCSTLLHMYTHNSVIDWCLTPTLVIFQLYRGFKL